MCDIHSVSFIFAQLGEGCGVKETPQQKYQRLVNEIQELTQEVDAIQVSWRLDTKGVLAVWSLFQEDD